MLEAFNLNDYLLPVERESLTFNRFGATEALSREQQLVMVMCFFFGRVLITMARARSARPAH